MDNTFKVYPFTCFVKYKILPKHLYYESQNPAPLIY